jgi:hypothetical protein
MVVLQKNLRLSNFNPSLLKIGIKFEFSVKAWEVAHCLLDFSMKNVCKPDYKGKSNS